MSLELKSLIAKLNPNCRKAFEQAAELCVAQKNYNVEIEHLVLKLLDLTESDVPAILRHYDVPVPRLKGELTRAIEKFKRGNQRTPSMSPYILTLLREAWLVSSLQFEHRLIRSGAMLLALVDHDVLRGNVVEMFPALLKIRRESLRENLPELIKGSNESQTPALNTSGDETQSSPTIASPTPSLDQYTVDLTEDARAGKIDPIEGRDTEINQIIDILTRRRQNNPILTGEAGVGKTAVVEGFALWIAKNEVPPSLQSVSLRMLDLGLLQAGAGVKGEFENRLKSVIREVKASTVPIILFVDEAHTLIGAGAQAGQGDAANLLKPALARGELRTIAATTWSEYKNYFEKDPALTRRFQVIKVDEPSEEVAITMLRSVVTNLERHHQVRVTDEAVHDAVRLSHRYISDRQLPDKAISVLDTACARVSIAQNSSPPVLKATGRRIQRMEEELRLLQREQATGHDHSQRIGKINNELVRLNQLKLELAERWQNELGLVKKWRELEDKLAAEKPTKTLQTELDTLKQQLTAIQGNDPMIPTHVDGHIIATVISGWTAIPVGKMLTDEIKTILQIQNNMATRIIGQPQALESITRRIQTYRANLDDPNKPMGVFLLVGPSGVGKTETALTLAELLYGGEQNLVTVNMSEYQEAHTVSSLKGAPPGYVGYGKGGVLTEAVRRNPYSVILLDEIEKAHPDVIELFYQVFDKGTLEDSEGLVVNFKNTLILLTSNLGTNAIAQIYQHLAPTLPSDEQLQEVIRPELLYHFKPAFLGRLVVVPFHQLGDIEIRRIAKLKLAKVQQRFWENHHARLTYDSQLVTMIVNRCTEVDTGARHIDHILTDGLLPTLSVKILERMANSESFSGVHLSCDKMGRWRYRFKSNSKEMTSDIDFDEAKTTNHPCSELIGDLDALLDWLNS